MKYKLNIVVVLVIFLYFIDSSLNWINFLESNLILY